MEVADAGVRAREGVGEDERSEGLPGFGKAFS